MLVIFGTALVMFMTPGLAQFYGGLCLTETAHFCSQIGMVRTKNTVSTMMLSAINMGMHCSSSFQSNYS
jgi:ammonia channel protein AmtB